jgi:hypothetical protein
MDNLGEGRRLRVSAKAEGGFFRLGRHWPKEGVIVAASAIDAAGWEVLRGELNLHVDPAPEEDAVPDPEVLKAAVRGVLASLAPEDFGKDGKPKVPAVRKALPDARGVTPELVAEVWAGLKPAD